MEPHEIKELVQKVRSVEVALGDGIKRPHLSELSTQIVARRSLVTVSRIEIGEALNESNVTLKRPATGIDPRLWTYVKGLKARVTIPADVPITWEMLA
jgi:N,N'-diacetyllegionaminate synthase